LAPIAFFFGPVAGALVSVISLRRMGFPLKAKRALLWTLLATAVLAAVLLATPDVYGRAIGFGAPTSNRPAGGAPWDGASQASYYFRHLHRSGHSHDDSLSFPWLIAGEGARATCAA
jgi:hypothetical protein